MLLDAQGGWAGENGQVVRADQEVCDREGFVAVPVSNLIVDKTEAGTAVHYLVCSDYLSQSCQDPLGDKLEWELDAPGVLMEALPVALECERMPLVNTNRGKHPPAIEQTGLSGGETRLGKGQDAVIVIDKIMHDPLFLFLRIQPQHRRRPVDQPHPSASRSQDRP